MKKFKFALMLAAAAGIAAPLFGELTPEQKQVFEALGWMQGNSMKTQIKNAVEGGLFTAEEGAAIQAGLPQGIAQDKPSFDAAAMEAKIQAIMQEKQKAMQAKMEADVKVEAQKAAQYLADLDKNPAIKKTASGLRYEIIAVGDAAKPTATDTVKVHYTGKLTNGTTFDSSVDRKEPATFALNEVIPAWTEGVQLIGKGGKIKLYAPSDLAYGPNGVPPVIPPNATLVFDVELLDINPPVPAAAPAATPAK